MENPIPFSYRKHLERVDVEVPVGGWRVGSYVDQVSDRKFLLFRHKSDLVGQLHPVVVPFRSETAVALAPTSCPPVMDLVQKSGQLEFLTAYYAPLDASPLDADTLPAMFRWILQLLATFEKNCFVVGDLRPEAIARDTSGALVLMPSAYVLPPPGEASSGYRRQTTGVSPHLAGLGDMMRRYVRPDAAVERPHPYRGSNRSTDLVPTGNPEPFREALARTATAILSGEVRTLTDVFERLFGEAPPQDMVSCGASGAAPNSDAFRAKLETITSRIGKGHIVEVSGGPSSGKTTLLRELAAELSGAPTPSVCWADEWDLAPAARKRVPAKNACEGAVWLVDDIDDKAFVHSCPFDLIFAAPGEDNPASVVYTLDTAVASKDLRQLLDGVRNRAGERFVTVALDSPGAEDALAARLSTLIEAAYPGSAPRGSAAGLAAELLAALLPQERRIVELLAVSRFPLPCDIVVSIFPESNGDLHRHVHRLAGLDLVQIDYRALPLSGQTAITFSIPSASLRRLIYDTIAPDRLEKLHRTVARMYEARGGTPTLFVFDHLMRGREPQLAARQGVSLLREIPREKRTSYLNRLIAAFVAGGLLEELPISDRLFAMHELAADLGAAGRAVEAEELLLRARAVIEAADSEERRKDAAIVCETDRLLAETWSARGNYAPALSLLNHTKDSLNPYLALPAQALLLNDIGWLQYRLGDYEGALDSCKVSLNTLNATEHPLIVAQALNVMGVIHFNTSRYDEAISYYEQSAFLREREGDVNALSASYNNLALAYQTKGEYDKALGYYNKSLEIKKVQNNRAGIAAGYLNLALLNLDLHDYEEAKKKCMESLDISLDLGHTRLAAENYSTMGDIEFKRGHHDSAEEHYRRSLDLAHSLETINEEMGAHRRLAKLYLTKQRFKEAREAIEHAAQLDAQIGSRFETAQIEMILGDLDHAEGRDSQAIQHYESAAGAYATVSKYRLVAPALAKIGLIHAAGGNMFEAKQFLDRALEHTKSEIGHEIPDEILTLQQTLRERPIRTAATGTATQKLLYAFYELSSLADYADDRAAFFKRITAVLQDLTGASTCFLAVQSGEIEFVIINRSGEQEPLVDTALRALFTRTLQLGVPLDSTSEEVADLRGQVQVPAGSAFVCVPMRAMGKNLGCLLAHVTEGSIPLSKEDSNFFTSMGRHIAGDVRLMLHLEEHTHKEEKLEKEFESLKQQVVDQYRFENLIVKDETMKKLFRTLEKIKDMDTGILLLGESGTGKTELARVVHYTSPRRKRLFQELHCAEIPVNLLESELFGHEKGAFTGAVQRKLGRCEVADRGTVFLDDVNVIPMEIQTKLLHYLEGKSFTRLGGTQKITTDVRIIAASNQDLEQLVKEGKFREDLYYRLKVVQIELPPLRERKQDMIAIAMAFLKKRCQAQGKTLKTLSSETIKLLQKYPWPGNVRELQNVLEQVVLLSDDEIVEPSSLPEDFLKRATGSSRHLLQSLEALAQQMVESGSYSEANPLMPQIEALLASKMTGHVQSKSKAAGLLGITKPTLYTRLRGYDKMH